MTDIKPTNTDHGCALPTGAKTARAFASGPSIALGPNLPCVPRTVRLNFHVLQKTDGTGNFPNDVTTVAIFDKMLDWLNAMFTFLVRSSLPAYTTFQPDARIRFRLVGTHFHQNDADWDVKTGTQCGFHWYNKYGVNKQKELNVFFIGPGGGGCGPSPFFLNMTHTYGGSDPNNYYGLTQILAHEIAHCLNLPHTFPFDNFPDTPPELSWGWFPSNSTTTSNNIAGYNLDRNFFSRMQLETMHGHLRSVCSTLCDQIMAPPSPRGLAIADVPNIAAAAGLWCVEINGDLVRAYWEGNRWNIAAVASPTYKIVPGSLVSAGPTGLVYGVNDRYEIIAAEPGNLAPSLIGGPEMTPGSLVNGFSSDLYGVDINRNFVRVTSSGVSQPIQNAPFTVAGSLVPTRWAGIVRIFGVSESYRILYAQNLSATTITVAGIRAVPGTLADGGQVIGIVGVDENRNIIRIAPGLTPSAHSASSLGGIQPGSLVSRKGSNEVYGVTPKGRIVLIADATGVKMTAAPASIPDVVPGSLVDGFTHGLFGIVPGGDLVEISLVGSSWTFATIPKHGDTVIAGSLVSLPDVDGGRTYGITEKGNIAGTWNDSGTLRYFVIG